MGPSPDPASSLVDVAATSPPEHRYAVLLGSSMLDFAEDIECLLPPDEPIVLKRIPMRQTEGEKNATIRPVPREAPLGVSIVVGTIDEIVALFRYTLENSAAFVAADPRLRAHRDRTSEIIAREAAGGNFVPEASVERQLEFEL